MDKLKRLPQFIISISLAISAVLAQQAASWVEKQKTAPGWLPAIVALLIIGGGSYALRLFLELFLDSSKRLRKFILGRQFIEGTWLDISKAEGQPIIIAVSRIEFAGSSVRFAGEDFSMDTRRRGHYLTDIAWLDWPRLKYKYTYQVSDACQISNQGYGEKLFIERDGLPREYVGFYFDLLEGKRVTYEGWRVEDPALLRQLDDPKTRRQAAIDFFKWRIEELGGSR